MEKYREIIDLPHHVSKTRPQMPMSDRAAQFAPFAALTGYDAAIKETGRLTDERIELDEEALTALDMKYQLLMDALDDKPEVTITYFQPDERKAGGKYVSAVGTVKKVDDFERRITMQDGSKIPMDDVLIIDGEIFSSLLLQIAGNNHLLGFNGYAVRVGILHRKADVDRGAASGVGLLSGHRSRFFSAFSCHAQPTFLCS